MAAGVDAAVPSSWRRCTGGQISNDTRATRVGQPLQRPTTSAKQQQWRGSVTRATPDRGMQYNDRHGITAENVTRVPARGSTGTAVPRPRDADAGGRSDQRVTHATGERLDANHQLRSGTSKRASSSNGEPSVGGAKAGTSSIREPTPMADVQQREQTSSRQHVTGAGRSELQGSPTHSTAERRTERNCASNARRNARYRALAQ